MKCSLCGGLVTWRGPLTNLTHTQCDNCGQRNCQMSDDSFNPEMLEPDNREYDELGLPLESADDVGELPRD